MSTPPLAPLSRAVVDDVVRRALLEDLGRGDVTTDACVPPELEGRAELIARVPLVCAGLDVFEAVFSVVDPSVRLERRARDGQALGPKTVAAVVSGPSNSILKGERVALNFVQRMSGVATKTRALVDALPAGSTTRIADTRKTTPGLRALERYAVRAGGGHNHRDDLSSAVLIKDNHIAAVGGVRQAIERARAYAPHTSRIECEVKTFAELDEALAARADIIMLDDFDDADLKKAVGIIAGRALVEVSGSVTLERVPVIAAAGVDVISVGGLTHSAPAMDFALDWIV